MEKRELEFKHEHENISHDKDKFSPQSPPMSPTNSDKINDDQQSDDSGFAVSPETAKKYELKNNFSKNKIVEPKIQPRPTNLVITRAISTPQLFMPSPPVKKFNFAPTQKGIMERFIASRGKMVPYQQSNSFQGNMTLVCMKMSLGNLNFNSKSLFPVTDRFQLKQVPISCIFPEDYI